MKKFSDRLGLTQAPTEIQLNGINLPLKNTLWNFLYQFFPDDYVWREILTSFFLHHYKFPLDQVPGTYLSCKDWFKRRFMESEWYEVYNILEFIQQEVLANSYERPVFEKNLNSFLERELSGYRSINGSIVPIASEHEKVAIEAAFSTSYQSVNEHIVKALGFLGKKPEPDYPNSIKESVSAVESACKLISGEKGDLDKALAILSGKGLHPAMKGAFSKLYGYASDADGIRHAMLDKDSASGFSEAKYMLVTCSAFVNYLIDKTR